MASLEAEMLKMEEQKKKALQAAAQKPRLTADPGVQVGDLDACFMGWLKFKETTNLWMTLVPPVGGPAVFSFKTKPRAPWLAKVVGLFYDLALLVPNTKIQSTKLKAAFRSMMKGPSPTLTNTTSKKDEDFIHMLDVTVRILFAHFRQICECDEIKKGVWKELGAKDKISMQLLCDRLRIRRSDEQMPDKDDDEEEEVTIPSAIKEFPVAAPTVPALSYSPVKAPTVAALSYSPDTSKKRLAHCFDVIQVPSPKKAMADTASASSTMVSLTAVVGFSAQVGEAPKKKMKQMTIEIPDSGSESDTALLTASQNYVPLAAKPKDTVMKKPAAAKETKAPITKKPAAAKAKAKAQSSFANPPGAPGQAAP